jgi:hypothetical protein
MFAFLASLACVLYVLGAQGRIPPDQRKFSSPAIESVISSMTSRLKDPELAELFENCFPNCLDTTVSSYVVDPVTHIPSTFVITGDITATWYISFFWVSEGAAVLGVNFLPYAHHPLSFRPPPPLWPKLIIAG